MSDSLVQLKANRSTAKRQFSRLANNVQRMYTVLSEEELKDNFKTLIIEANKVFEANDDVEDQYVLESQLEGEALTEQQREDLEKTKSECENRLDELKELILTTLWAKYGEEELKMVVEAAELEAEHVGAIQPSEDEEGYDFMVKHLGTLIGRAKALHTKWKCWAPATEQKDLQSRVSDLERSLLKLTARKAEFIQIRVKDKLSSTINDCNKTPAIKMNVIPLAKFPGTKCDFHGWKKDWKEQQECGAREVQKLQLLDSIDEVTIRDLRLFTCSSADDIFRVLDKHFGNKSLVAKEIVDEIQKLPPVGNEPRKVIALIQLVEKASLELSNLGETGVLKDPLVVTKSIEGKLPEDIKKEWLIYAAEKGEGQDKRFDILLRFLRSQKPIYEQLNKLSGKDSSKPRYDSKPNGSSVYPGCVVCGDTKHSQRLYFCKRFQVLKLSEKKDAIKKLGACVKCLEIHSEHDNCKEEFFCKRPECSKNKEHHFLLCPKPAPKTRVIALGGDSRKSYTDAQKGYVKRLHPGLPKGYRHVFSNSVTKLSHATSNQSTGGEKSEGHHDAAQGNGQRWVRNYQTARPGFRYKSYQSQSSQKTQPAK